MRSKKLITFGLPIIVVILLDQFAKYEVRTTVAFQNWDIIPGWLAFHYTLNPGMAMGMNWVSTPVVSIISIIATIGIIGYVFYTMKRARLGYLFCMGLVVGGALGNIIDRLIMGIIGGYGGVLEGHVIDFIHFTATIHGYPVFPYIFNVADSAITTAIIALLIFNKQIVPEKNKEADMDSFAYGQENEVDSKEKAVTGNGMNNE